MAELISLKILLQQCTHLVMLTFKLLFKVDL